MPSAKHHYKDRGRQTVSVGIDECGCTNVDAQIVSVIRSASLGVVRAL